VKPKWLNGCEICNAGLCEEMDKFIEKHKLSERTAADQLSKVVKDKLGFMLYSGKQLRDRYRYHKGKDKVAEIPPPQGATTVKTKGNSKTAQRTSSVASTVVAKPKQVPDTFKDLLAHAHAFAAGLQSWCDGEIKPSSDKEVETAEAILDALADIVRQYKKLIVSAQPEGEKQEDQTT
jgi:hypothetical protein